MKEIIIQRAILDYLAVLENRGKVYCFRAGAGMIPTKAGGMFKTGRAGCPDIICCADGKFIGLEVKNEKGKMSTKQKEAQELIERTGGRYHVVRSIDDVEKLLTV
jgi:hypothetical protein